MPWMPLVKQCPRDSVPGLLRARAGRRKVQMMVYDGDGWWKQSFEDGRLS